MCVRAARRKYREGETCVACSPRPKTLARLQNSTFQLPHSRRQPGWAAASFQAPPPSTPLPPAHLWAQALQVRCRCYCTTISTALLWSIRCYGAYERYNCNPPPTVVHMSTCDPIFGCSMVGTLSRNQYRLFAGSSLTWEQHSCRSMLPNEREQSVELGHTPALESTEIKNIWQGIPFTELSNDIQ